MLAELLVDAFVCFGCNSFGIAEFEAACLTAAVDVEP